MNDIQLCIPTNHHPLRRLKPYRKQQKHQTNLKKSEGIRIRQAISRIASHHIDRAEHARPANTTNSNPPFHSIMPYHIPPAYLSHHSYRSLGTLAQKSHPASRHVIKRRPCQAKPSQAHIYLNKQTTFLPISSSSSSNKNQVKR
jgi:hypothetical protein